MGKIMKQVFIPHLNAHVKLGRTRPVAQCPRLKLGNYLSKSLPVPPATSDYAKAAKDSLANVYLNDQLGDCVIAGIAHLVGVFTGNATGTPVMFTESQITSLYSAIGGYVPGRPNTDQGCDEQTALNYWQHHGAPNGSHQIAGWLSVNAQDPNEYKVAMWLFENLFFGIELPDAWLSNNLKSGFVWGPGRPNPDNGHCVVGVGHDSTGIQIATWGMVGTITDAAIQQVVSSKSGGELYVVISQDIINKANLKAPNGLDWSQLVSDFNAIGGNIMPPSPTPVPPVPVPPVPVPPAPVPVPSGCFAARMLKRLIFWN